MAGAAMEDISVQWGGSRGSHDQAWAKWWRAVFQDMEPSGDGNRLYFLYDPAADEEANGSRKSGPSILIFDTVNKTFFREIPIPIQEKKQGVLKNFFLVNAQTNTFCLITDRKEEKMTLWHLQLSPDGLNIASGPNQLFGPIPWEMDYIYVMRDDAPEIVYLTGPGLTVWRVNALSPGAAPVDSYKVPGGNMEFYYDAVAWRGKVYICGCNDDESFDFYNVSVLDLQTRQLQRAGTRPDPAAGYPCQRKQCGLDRFGGKLYLTGGEAFGPQGLQRLNDMWTLDLTSMQWERQHDMNLNIPLIEPRLAISQNNGLVHVWGDCDLPNGCLAPPSHLHILKTWLRNAEAPPPAYNNVAPPPYPSGGGPTAPPTYPPQDGGASAPPPAYPQQGGGGAYPQQGGGGGAYPPQSGGGGGAYPPQGGAYQQAGGAYPTQGSAYPQQGGAYPQQGGGAYPQQGGAYPQQGYGEKQPAYMDGASGSNPPPYQPNQQKKDKDCSIS